MENNIEERVIRRINCISKSSVLSEAINKLKIYNINFYNSEGIFEFNNFRDDCIKTAEILWKNDKPINGIKYQLCDFVSAIQTIVGIRNIGEFMGTRRE